MFSTLVLASGASYVDVAVGPYFVVVVGIVIAAIVGAIVYARRKK